LIILQLCFACKQDVKPPAEDFNVVVRIDRDIGRISPILARSSRERDVYSYVFLNLADYDPKTLELSPVLIDELPDKTVLNDGRVKYSFRLLDEAVWDNGENIEAADVLFTLKLIAHPNIVSPSAKSQMSNIDEVVLYESDKKKFDFLVKKEEANTVESLCGFEIYPEYVYDPDGVLSGISIKNLWNEEFSNNLLEQDSSFVTIAADFSSSKFGTEIVAGAGPYNLIDWETDQYIRLQRKENWWGNQFPNRSPLNAGPQEIVFQIIADETTAITKLKAGEIDLMKITDGQAFSNLENEMKDQLDFHTPKIQQFVYLAINNQDEIMKFHEVRKALAMSLDTENVIEVIESGTADQIVGTFESFVSSYKSGLIPIRREVDRARKLLEDNGWGDQNNDGIFDKYIDSRLTELKLEMLCSSDKSEKMGLLVRDYAKDVGIDISLNRKTFANIQNNHVYKGDYQMFPMVSRWGLSPYDPYGRWHSDNAKSRGGNICYYKNQEVDSLINLVRVELDGTKRNKLYTEIEKIVYDDQPVIFLYSPLDKIVSNKKIKAFTANKRPGYFVNLFQLNTVPAFSEN